MTPSCISSHTGGNRVAAHQHPTAATRQLDFAGLPGQGFVLTPQRMLLGVGPQDILHTTILTGLCHVAICGANGGVKATCTG